MKHRPFFFGLLVFLFLLPLQGEGVKVVIVHTSDAHGHIGPQPYPVSHRPAPVLLGGYPSLKTFLHQTKLNTYKEGGLPIWLDSGDFFQGTPIVSKTKGSCMVDFLNALSLVTTTLGNHDFDYGYVNLKKQFSRANFPVVDCNIFEAASGRLIPWAKPYIIIPFKGVKIGIIGITTPDSWRT
ncbi:metallophosphoesterase [bacterium]|nr:metallophosphoesterase [bacterium]